MAGSLLTVSPSPHIHQELTVPQVMRGVIVAMLPALAYSFYAFGYRAIYVNLLAISFCVAVEYVIAKYLLGKKPNLFDGSAIITGMLLAFNVPSSLPWHIILIGSIVAVGVGKMSFGGLGNNPFNPALVGRVFLLISFPVEMTTWPKAGTSWEMDGITEATPLGIIKDGMRGGEQQLSDLMATMPSYSDMFFGFQGGSLGEMSALALIVGLIYMLARKIITWHIPIVMVATVFVFSGILWLVNPEVSPDPVFQILTGGVMLGAIFMATDYVTSPVTHKGMIIFAVGCGLITVIIRQWGGYPEGVSFAILIMNGFVPLINRYLKPKRYGAQKEGKLPIEKLEAVK